MKSIIITLALATLLHAQTAIVPAEFRIDTALSSALHGFVEQCGLGGDWNVGDDGTEQISLAVIPLGSGPLRIGGVHMTNFIYPASVYKMYVAAAALAKAYEGKLSLTAPYIVPIHNAVDGAREVLHDPRPLLRAGDTVTVQYLLDLMITRSDNSAANCLIDLATRPYINQLMLKNGWEGSEVTRKFLKRKFEDPGYDTIRGTETCALHAADFIFKATRGKLYNHWVSSKLMFLLGSQLDNTKLSGGLPKSAVFMHKTGWFSYWTNDVGMVVDSDVSYIIACFTPVPEDEAKPKMAKLASLIHEYIYELPKRR